ncbi:hypothetical protein V8C26DRAFT_43682 [Trichoderma gracile]
MHKVEESGAMPALTSQQQGLVTARASIPCPHSRSNRGPCIRKPNSTWQKTAFGTPASQQGIIFMGTRHARRLPGVPWLVTCAPQPAKKPRERGSQHQPQTDMTSLSCHQATAM